MQIFVLTGQGINSEPVTESLRQLQHTNNKVGEKYNFNVVSANPANLCAILEDPETIAGFIPGGDSSQQTRAQIGQRGMKTLHDFVTNDGGALTGICKGGYMLGENVIYGSCFPAEFQRQSRQNIDLIKATYYGPLQHLLLDYAFEHPDKPYISLANIAYGEDTIQTPIVYWHGGVPVLKPGQKELRPLAKFSDPFHVAVDNILYEKVDPIAIGVKDFPLSGGKAISSTVHPEVSGDYLEKYSKYMAKSHSHYAALQKPYEKTASVLKENKSAVFGLFKVIVDEMLDCGKAHNLTARPSLSCMSYT